MKNATRKLVSMVLVAIMVIGLLPALTLPAMAASPLSDQIGLEFLLRGFNVLSGQELRNDTLATGRIVQSGASDALRGYYDADHINRTTGGTHYGRSTVDWAISAGIDMSISKNAEAGVGKLFKASASSKFGLTENAAYKNSYDSLFFYMLITHANTQNSLTADFRGSPGLRSAIQENLNQQFINDLANPNVSPGYIFNTYGTHFLTAYNAGGKIERLRSVVNTKTTIAADLRIDFETKAGVSGPGLAAKADFDLGVKIAGEYDRGDYITKEFFDIRGGVGGVSFSDNAEFNTNVVNAWINSFVRSGSNANCAILVDDGLDLVGIWGLLPEDNVYRYNELISYYIEEAIKQDLEFFEEFHYRTSPPALPIDNLPKPNIDNAT